MTASFVETLADRQEEARRRFAESGFPTLRDEAWRFTDISPIAKARFTAVVEEHMSDVTTGVQKAIAHNVCGAPPVKLSKAGWKPYALIKRMLQTEQKLARENAETNGWNVTQETEAVTEQFCAAVKARSTSPPPKSEPR